MFVLVLVFSVGVCVCSCIGLGFGASVGVCICICIGVVVCFGGCVHSIFVFVSVLVFRYWCSGIGVSSLVLLLVQGRGQVR